MTCVAQNTGMQVHFGDWHGNLHSRKKPDITIWDSFGDNLTVGEVKTPWTMNLQRQYMDYSDPLEFQDHFYDFAGKMELCTGPLMKLTLWIQGRSHIT